jgi:hypothetical protein
MRALARRTFHAFATNNIDDARIAVKLVETLSMDLASLGGPQKAVAFVHALVHASKQDSKALRPAVAMLRAYPELLDELGEQGGTCAGVLAEFVGNGQRKAAIEVALYLDRMRQVCVPAHAAPKKNQGVTCVECTATHPKVDTIVCTVASTVQ